MTEATDELFEIKNCFYLGNYQGGINEGLGVKGGNDELLIERDCFIYRCYIGQGNFQLVIDEIKDSSPAPLKTIKLLATYLRSPEQSKDIVLASLKQLLSDPSSISNKMLFIVGGIIYLNEGNYDDALRCLHQSTQLEAIALKLQIYIKLNRLDLAEKELRELQKLDDDATLTHLSSAWLNLAHGGEKVQEAFYSFTELSEKHSPTAKILNGLAICEMHSKKFDDAERHLLESLEKNPKDNETLANLVTCYVHQGKPKELISRNIGQLKTNAPSHPWVLELSKTEDIFQRSAQRFAV